MKNSIKSVNIRPGVGFLSLLPHLNYKPWFALAEFVDNSLQSSIIYHDELERIEGKDYKLKVDIELDLTDHGRIIIRDNAAGIREEDYPRAFRPAELPPDRSGLSEFGIGMKSAACWFADYWSVRTTALGEDVERTIAFDTKTIVRDNLENLVVQEQFTSPNSHYTEVVLTKLGKFPKGRTVGKIKEHLASIFRVFIRKNILELRFDNEILQYAEPRVLVAPYYRTKTDMSQMWRKEIEFDFGLGQRVSGFAALRETASLSNAGFALFRRDRLIEGSGDETYRPEFIFEKSNSFIFQRLFGELHLEGFEVSHTKDGFQWEEYEEIFLEFLKDELNREPLPLLNQAEGFRVRPKAKELKSGAETATQRTSEVIKQETPQILQKQLVVSEATNTPPLTLPIAQTLSQKVIDIELNGSPWQIVLELSNDPAIGDWVDLCDQLVKSENMADSNVRQIGIRVALAHPFMERFGGMESSQIEPLLRLAVAIVLAETTARDSGVRQAGTIRRNVNDLLRNALSRP